MKAVIQRVIEASVTVDGHVITRIGPGILTFLGVALGDSKEHVHKIVQKIIGLRIFEDSLGKMNLSLKETGGSHLIVSQFTLLADTTKGKRPSFTNAERPDTAKALYEYALHLSNQEGIPSVGGQFQTDMKVNIINDGPVTLIIDVP